ncbi:MAG: creatininase family protein [Eubacteriales bacterium]|nr:creatininase family protein [Eubacteriales bacterium]
MLKEQKVFKRPEEGRDSVWFQDNSAQVNLKYIKEVNDFAILPIGAIEQHSAHCPTGMDSFNAIGLAEKVAEKSGATVLPCPMYGGHPYMHMGMPCTIPLNYETNIALLHDIIAGAANAGFNKFLILSAHGQDSSMYTAVHKLGMEGYFTMVSNWYDFLRDDKEVLDTFMWHADEAESSMGLSLYPDKMHMDLVFEDDGKTPAVDSYGTKLVDGKWKMAPGEASHPWQMYHFGGTFALMEKDDLPYGVIGEPSRATKEKGDKMVERVTDGFAELIKEIMTDFPVGINPLGFRNPLGFMGCSDIKYDEHHDEKGRLIK